MPRPAKQPYGLDRVLGWFLNALFVVFVVVWAGWVYALWRSPPDEKVRTYPDIVGSLCAQYHRWEAETQDHLDEITQYCRNRGY